jgi:phosphoribulokinase
VSCVAGGSQNCIDILEKKNSQLHMNAQRIPTVCPSNSTCVVLLRNIPTIKEDKTIYRSFIYDKQNLELF